MKRVLLVGSLLATTLYSQDITIQEGWQLLGATENLDTAMFDSSGCVDYMWKYDESNPSSPWQVHISNDNSYNITVPTFDQIAEGEGFWVKGNSSCSINTPTDTTDFKALLAGNTFYVVGQDASDTTDIEIGEITFNTDLTEFIFRDDSGQEEIISISLDGNRWVSLEDTDNSYTIISKENNDYIMFTDYNGDGSLDGEHRLYFDKAKADAYVATLGESVTVTTTPDYTPITEDMLSNKTFYEKMYEDDGGYGYAVMTLGATEDTRHEIWYNSDGSVRDDRTFTVPFVLIDGKIRADAGDEYKWFTLVSQDENAWYLINDDDVGKDGTIDKPGEQNTWYLSKPSNFPASL